jgi:uncharacterized membrane protein
MNTKTWKLTTTALMIALTLILGLTPVGYIPNPFGIFPWTLMCIPVIIGAIVLGWRLGLVLGLVFGFTSLYLGLSSAAAALIIQAQPVAMVASIFIPRLLVPIAAWGIYTLTKRIKRPVAIGLAAAAASLTNTVFFLGMIYLLAGEAVAAQFGLVGMAFLSMPAIINGLPEMALAVLICVPVILALKNVIKE